MSWLLRRAILLSNLKQQEFDHACGKAPAKLPEGKAWSAERDRYGMLDVLVTGPRRHGAGDGRPGLG
jgi:hypothetical protein